MSASDTISASDAPAAQAPAARSAAREAFAIRDLRQEIFSSLERKDLLACVGLSKSAVSDVARELCRVMKYEDVQKILAEDSSRQQTYLDAIVEINGRPLHPPTAILDQLRGAVPGLISGHTATPDDIAHNLIDYHPAIFNHVVAPLKERCPNLRTVLLGRDYRPNGRDSWTVHFTPDSSLGISTSDPSGRIDLIGTEHFRNPISHPLSFSYGPAVAPSAAFPISHRFDVAICGDAHVDAEETRRWEEAFRAAPILDGVYKSLLVEEVPLRLEAMTALCERQERAGHKERLSSISVLDVAPWNIGDFQSFARVTSSQLIALALSRQEWSGSLSPLITVNDLPSLIDTITPDMPNLQFLCFQLDDITQAEAVCGPLLRPDILETRGNLRHLLIATPPTRTTLFNTIRYLSQLCAADADIVINQYGHELWDGESQTAYLRELLTEPSESRRAALAVADFEALGIADPSLIPDLRFDEDGNGKRAIEGKASEWATTARFHVGATNKVRIPQLQKHLADCLAACERLEADAAGATDDQLLDGAEQALALAEAATEAAEELVGISSDQLFEMRKYVQSMRETI